MSVSGLQVRVLGPVSVSQGAALVALPRSRKVRALLGFLALSPSAVSRSRLCGLLWDVPNDPRGELRWSLSKLRGVLDDPDRRRVITSEGNLIALDLSDCVVDAFEVDRIARAGIAVRPASPPGDARGARQERPHPGRGAAPRCHYPLVRTGGARLGADPRRLASHSQRDGRGGVR